MENKEIRKLIESKKISLQDVENELAFIDRELNQLAKREATANRERDVLKAVIVELEEIVGSNGKNPITRLRRKDRPVESIVRTEDVVPLVTVILENRKAFDPDSALSTSDLFKSVASARPEWQDSSNSFGACIACIDKRVQKIKGVSKIKRIKKGKKNFYYTTKPRKS